MIAEYGKEIVIALYIAAFAMSIVLHEVAHGWVALRCGDPTAMLSGRLSLNPVKHIDPFLTIILPILTFVTMGFPFGGAKPVPVNRYNFRNLEIDDIKVSLAGVTVNFLLALAFGFSVRLWTPGSPTYWLFEQIALINLLLAFFNLMPVPPLDGSHVARYFIARISRQLADYYEMMGMFGMVLIMLMAQFNLLPYHIAINYVWVHILGLPAVFH